VIEPAPKPTPVAVGADGGDDGEDAHSAEPEDRAEPDQPPAHE